MKKSCLTLLKHRKLNRQKPGINPILLNNNQKNVSIDFGEEQEIEFGRTEITNLSAYELPAPEPKGKPKRERRDSTILNAFAFLTRESLSIISNISKPSETVQEKLISKNLKKSNAKIQPEICVIDSFTKLKLLEQFISNQILNSITIQHQQRSSTKAKTKQKQLQQSPDDFYTHTLATFLNFMQTSEAFKSQTLSAPITTSKLTQFFWSSMEFQMQNEHAQEKSNISLKDMKVLSKKFKGMLKKFEGSVGNAASKKSRERRETI